MEQTRTTRRWVKPLVIALAVGTAATLVPVVLMVLMFSMGELG